MRAGGREQPLAENAPLRRTVAAARAPAGLERRLGDEASALWDPRFGLEPLIELGLPLSPPRPALLGGRPPVGRAGARGPQAAPTLETLLGRGDFDSIARLIESGLLDPAALPPSVRADVLQRTRAPAPAPTPAAETGGGDLQVEAGMVDPAVLPPNVRADVLARTRARAPAAAPTAEAAGGGVTGDVLTATRLGRLAKNVGERAFAPTAVTPEAGVPQSPAEAGPALRISYEPLGVTPEARAAAAILDAEREQAGAGLTPSAVAPTLGMTPEARAAFMALATGDISALPPGVVTPEVAAALAAASARTGGSVATEGEPVGRPLTEEDARRLALEAARAGGSVPGPPARPDLRISYEPLPTLPAEAPSAGSAQVGTAPTGGGAISHGANAALGLAGGAARIAEGETAGGAIEAARGATEAAAALGAEIPYAGPALALAQIGEGASRGDQAGERAAVRGAMALAGTLIPGFGVIFGVGQLAETLINLGLAEYTQGDLSKAIMAARQKFLYQYGNQAVEEALRTAPDLAAAMRALSAGPPGTQGQVQFGVGAEFAGVNDAPGAVTPRWQAIVRGMSAPTTLAEHPDLVASFIQNLWVQTGPSGTATFDPAATRDYQTYLLSKLPYTPDWLAARQKILNMAAVDPRDQAARDRALAAVPDLPVEPGFLRVNGLRIPVDHRYRWFDGSSGVWHDYSPERVGQTVTPFGAGTIYDETAGRWLGQGGAPHAATDAAYLDPEAMATPWFREKAGALRDEWQGRIPPPLDPEQRAMGATEPYNPIDMRAVASLEGFLAESTARAEREREQAAQAERERVKAQELAAAKAEEERRRAEAPPAPAAAEVSPPPVAESPLPVPVTVPPTPIPAAAPPPATISPTEMPPAAPPAPSAAGPTWGGVTYPAAPSGMRWILPPADPAHAGDTPYLAPEPTGEAPPPALHSGGVVPRTGTYRLKEGEVVIPMVPTRRDASGSFAADLDAAITEDNRRVMERNAGRGPGEMMEMLKRIPEGSWYLDPARGLPFRSGTNPEPEAVWRLAFDADQLHDAWKRRGTDGWPLLVPPSVLERGDWPAVVERARRTQYEGVHPAVALARAVPPTTGPEGVEDEDLAQGRFEEGLWEERAGLRDRRPVPPPEPTPPMRRMPGQRPMTPEEERGVAGPEEETV